MNKSLYKEGDRVMVVNPILESYKMQGAVTYVCGVTIHDDLIGVRLDNGKTITIKESYLLPPIHVPIEEAAPAKHFAMMHYHNNEYNPLSLEEAASEGVWGLDVPDEIFFGTIEEIKVWVENLDEYECCENAFVIIDSVLYPIEFKKFAYVEL